MKFCEVGTRMRTMPAVTRVALSDWSDCGRTCRRLLLVSYSSVDVERSLGFKRSAAEARERRRRLVVRILMLTLIGLLCMLRPPVFALPRGTIIVGQVDRLRLHQD